MEMMKEFVVMAVGNKMLKSFPLPVMKMPLLEYFPTASEEASFRIAFGVNRSNKVSHIVTLRLLRVTITLSFKVVDPISGTTSGIRAIIEFGDSYEAPQEELGTGSASESSTKKKGRTVALTTEDMQKRRNDVKAKTTLLLALPDEHQLRFSNYMTAQEL
nr:hypothetical protein [Tanacetum cinerariifolium]